MSKKQQNNFNRLMAWWAFTSIICMYALTKVSPTSPATNNYIIEQQTLEPEVKVIYIDNVIEKPIYIYIEKEDETVLIEEQITVLNKRDGVNYQPDGTKETYYNLPMSGVVNIMRNLGYNETDFPYWVREDGVKMFGSYVMVAAPLDIYPRGSITETSLGLGIVCDTGEMVGDWIDIAVDW